MNLRSLPDISKWNTSNVKNIEGIFNGCSSLTSLPDISKWNTCNVESMNNMFCDCKSLKSVPDLSKWNTQNITSTSRYDSGTFYFPGNFYGKEPNFNNIKKKY